RTGLGTGEHEYDGIDKAARVRRSEVAMRRKHGRFKREELALGEIERACRPALLVRKIDNDLAAVNGVLARLDACERVHQQFLTVLEHVFPFTENGLSLRLRLDETHHGYLVFDIVLGGPINDGLTRSCDGAPERARIGFDLTRRHKGETEFLVDVALPG